MADGRQKFFVEAVPLVDKQVSGVPHALAGLVAALAAHPFMRDNYDIVLIAPGDRLHLLDRWPGLERCQRKAVPLKFRIMNGLGRRGLLPPMDLVFGKGVYLFGNYFNWPLTRRSRSLTYIHDVCFKVHPEMVQPENQRSLAKNVPRYIRQSNIIITVSESARTDIMREFRVPTDKMLVLPNGVDRSLFRQYNPEEIQPVQQKYGLYGSKYFMFVGNIEPRKNLERLLDAMRPLPKEYGLLLVGSDGWQNEKIFEAITEANKAGRQVVKPQEYVADDEVAKLLAGAVALAHPAIYEGFGMTPLEALSAQMPVVVADIPPLREVVNGAGIYCDPFNTASITEALRQAINLSGDERQRLATIGVEHSKRFSWEVSAERLVGFLRRGVF